MEETRNNFFGSKIPITTFRQAKTGKYECQNMIATYKTNHFDFDFEHGFGSEIPGTISRNFLLVNS